MFTFIDYIAS